MYALVQAASAKTHVILRSQGQALMNERAVQAYCLPVAPVPQEQSLAAAQDQVGS